MRLGIVGHAAEKFDAVTERAARRTIALLVDELDPEVVVSGHSPMGGVDIWAEEVARDFGVLMDVHAPSVRRWDGPGGFKDRNRRIARRSDLVICVVVRDLPRGFRGMRFDGCYHCEKEGGCPMHHQKSGGCWTALEARAREWRVISPGGRVARWPAPSRTGQHVDP